MIDVNSKTESRNDDVLERLLKEASPRPVPSSDDTALARRAVRAEWRKMSDRRRSRRQVLQYAMAASVLLGVFAVFNAFRTPTGEMVEVASIQKSFGAIYFLGDAAKLRPADAVSGVFSGQTIVTGNEAGLALAWGDGGSLRIDANSRVEFPSRDAVFLHSGRLYFDSSPSLMMAGVTASSAGSLAVQTDHGRVMHAGTQFMTQVRPDALIVSVREGEVAITGAYHQHTATPGDQVTLVGRQRPSVLRIAADSSDWQWLGRTTPPVRVDGRSLFEFLHWASRETGLHVEFEGDAEAIARQAILRGSIDTEPFDALRLRLASAALGWRIDAGVLYVSNET